MRVLFDDQIYSMMTHGGVARYHYELIKALNHINVETNLPLFFSNNYYIRKRDVSTHISSLPFNFKIRCAILTKSPSNFFFIIFKLMSLYNLWFFNKFVPPLQKRV